MLSRIIIAFPPRSKHLLISWPQSPSVVILEPKTVACCGSGTLNTTMCAQVLLKVAAIIFITSTIVWPQVKLQGGNTALPTNRKLHYIFIEHGQFIRTRPSFPHSQSLPTGSFHKSVILIHQRAYRMKTQSQKTNKTDYVGHRLV